MYVLPVGTTKGQNIIIYCGMERVFFPPNNLIENCGEGFKDNDLIIDC